MGHSVYEFGYVIGDVWRKKLLAMLKNFFLGGVKKQGPKIS